MTVKQCALNNDLRNWIAAAKNAAGEYRESQYLREALANVVQHVARLKVALHRAESVLALPAGDPRRLGTVEKAKEERALYKDALADAAELQFDLENWMAGKAT